MLAPLAVQQGDIPGLDGQSLFVGRAAVNVLSESSIGGIFTYGDPNSDTITTSREWISATRTLDFQIAIQCAVTLVPANGYG